MINMDVQEEREKFRKELFDLRLKLMTMKTKDYKEYQKTKEQIKVVKRRMAKILTQEKEKEKKGR